MLGKLAWNAMTSGGSKSLRFPSFNRSTLLSASKNLVIDVAEMTAYSVAIDNVVSLWEEEPGSTPDSFNVMLDLILPGLLGAGRKRITDKFRADKLSDVHNSLKGMPAFTGLRSQFSSQLGVRNYGIVRDKDLRSVSILNGFGERTFTLSDKGVSVSQRIKDGLDKYLPRGLAAVGVVGGSSIGYDKLFGSSEVNSTIGNYLGLVGQSLEEAAGVDLSDLPYTKNIKLGDRWYDDIGALHREIFTNLRSVTNNLVTSMGIDEDLADDIIAKIFLYGADILQETSVSTIDIVGPALTSDDEETNERFRGDVSDEPEDSWLDLFTGGDENDFNVSDTFSNDEASDSSDRDFVSANSRRSGINSLGIG
jgi:hypothetical protein